MKKAPEPLDAVHEMTPGQRAVLGLLDGRIAICATDLPPEAATFVGTLTGLKFIDREEGRLTQLGRQAQERLGAVYRLDKLDVENLRTLAQRVDKYGAFLAPANLSELMHRPASWETRLREREMIVSTHDYMDGALTVRITPLGLLALVATEDMEAANFAESVGQFEMTVEHHLALAVIDDTEGFTMPAGALPPDRELVSGLTFSGLVRRTPQFGGWKLRLTDRGYDERVAQTADWVTAEKPEVPALHVQLLHAAAKSTVVNGATWLLPDGHLSRAIQRYAVGELAEAGLVRLGEIGAHGEWSWYAITDDGSDYLIQLVGASAKAIRTEYLMDVALSEDHMALLEEVWEADGDLTGRRQLIKLTNLHSTSRRREAAEELAQAGALHLYTSAMTLWGRDTMHTGWSRVGFTPRGRSHYRALRMRRAEDAEIERRSTLSTKEEIGELARTSGLDVGRYDLDNPVSCSRIVRATLLVATDPAVAELSPCTGAWLREAAFAITRDRQLPEFYDKDSWEPDRE